jgi:cobalt-zinc-cadmium efflux system membrane fusion protein
MTSRTRAIAIPLVAFALGAAATWLLRGDGSTSARRADPAEHGEAADSEAPTGPHGGRLLVDGDFALELMLVERGVPPELRAYPFQDEAPLDPARLSLDVALTRLGGRVDRIAFTPREDHLVSDHAIAEPHSFDVAVVARVGEREHRFAYPSHEGRVVLDAAMAAASGITTERAGPARVRTTVPLHGHVVPNAERTSHVTPRFPGVVREMRKRVGDPVAAGETVAVVESDESLRPYELRAGSAGTVIDRTANPGERASADRPLYTVSDLSTVWIDLHAHRSDAPRLRAGQRLEIQPSTGGDPIDGEIAYVAPVASESSQTLLARAVVPNGEGRLHPGFFVSAAATVEDAEVPLAVRVVALHDLGRGPVVFVREGDVFEATPIELGRRDEAFAEVRSGLEAGRSYAAENAFVLKADVGKSGASHDH